GAGPAGAVTAGAVTEAAGAGVLAADAVWNCAGAITCAWFWVAAGAATPRVPMAVFWLAVEARTASVLTRMAAMGSGEPGTGRGAAAAAGAGAGGAATTDPVGWVSRRAGSGRPPRGAPAGRGVPRR